jgi:hypothetical protein
MGELFCHPRTVDFAEGGVMKDVEPHRSPEEFPHRFNCT